MKIWIKVYSCCSGVQNSKITLNSSIFFPWNGFYIILHDKLLDIYLTWKFLGVVWINWTAFTSDGGNKSNGLHMVNCDRRMEIFYRSGLSLVSLKPKMWPYNPFLFSYLVKKKKYAEDHARLSNLFGKIVDQYTIANGIWHRCNTFLEEDI